ncbi:LOW QUALITY PROTEIN: hypothetical protein U9M48_025915 [Paspalum notatum var. saurae]|uniref:Uncharacterized protein n=1 Tax=Paspalum notatum var. saurae TaxID=547442 RepID=A0AAQ3TR20_PASNO
MLSLLLGYRGDSTHITDECLKNFFVSSSRVCITPPCINSHCVAWEKIKTTTNRLEEEGVVRGLVVPDEEQDADALLGLVLEQLAQAHGLHLHAAELPDLGRLRLHLRRHLPPHQPHPGVHGPPGHVHQPLRAQHREAQLLPAPPAPERPRGVDARHRLLAERHVRVLVQPHVAPAPQREAGTPASAAERQEAAADAAAAGMKVAETQMAGPPGGNKPRPSGRARSSHRERMGAPSAVARTAAAGSEAVPMRSEPKGSASLTWKSRRAARCASGRRKLASHLGASALRKTKVRASVVSWCGPAGSTTDT